MKADVIKMLTQTLIKTVSGGKYEQADLRFQFGEKSTLCFNKSPIVQHQPLNTSQFNKSVFSNDWKDIYW